MKGMRYVICVALIFILAVTPVFAIEVYPLEVTAVGGGSIPTTEVDPDTGDVIEYGKTTFGFALSFTAENNTTFNDVKGRFNYKAHGTEHSFAGEITKVLRINVIAEPLKVYQIAFVVEASEGLYYYVKVYHDPDFPLSTLSVRACDADGNVPIAEDYYNHEELDKGKYIIKY